MTWLFSFSKSGWVDEAALSKKGEEKITREEVRGMIRMYSILTIIIFQTHPQSFTGIPVSVKKLKKLNFI